MDLTKVSRNDWIVVAGAVLMFIGSLLPWYGVSVEFAGMKVVGDSWNGWHFSYLGWLTAFLCVAAAALVVTRALRIFRFELPVPDALLVMAAGGLSTLIVLVRMVVQPDFADLRWGIFIALLGALAVAGGGFMKNAEPASQGFADQNPFTE